jgi:hypothetical protein
MPDWSAFLTVLKQYGPLLGLLLFFIFWQWRQIQKLLESNSKIYEGHIKSLQETQDRLLTHLIGPRPSSLAAPTVEQITATASGRNPKESEGT